MRESGASADGVCIGGLNCGRLGTERERRWRSVKLSEDDSVSPFVEEVVVGLCSRVIGLSNVVNCEWN